MFFFIRRRRFRQGNLSNIPMISTTERYVPPTVQINQLPHQQTTLPSVPTAFAVYHTPSSNTQSYEGVSNFKNIALLFLLSSPS